MDNPNTDFTQGAGTAPPSGAVADLAFALARSSTTMGMYEAYDMLARRNRNYEPLTDRDTISIRALENIHDMASGALAGMDRISDLAYADGMNTVMQMGLEGQAPRLSDLRRAASMTIAEGWNAETDYPDLVSAQAAPDREPTDPFQGDIENPDSDADDPSM